MARVIMLTTPSPELTGFLLQTKLNLIVSNLAYILVILQHTRLRHAIMLLYT